MVMVVHDGNDGTGLVRKFTDGSRDGCAHTV